MIQPEEQSDAESLRRMAAGDEAGFHAIYRRCHGPIYRFALHMTGSSSIAEDVTQEVFVFFIEDPDKFDPARGALASYLFGIGRNMLARRLEKERAFVPFPDADGYASSHGSSNGSSNGFSGITGNASGNASSNGFGNGHRNNGHRNNGDNCHLITAPVDLVRNEAIDRVRQAVLTLPANYREAVVLCDLQEMSYEEAATILECAVGTVRSRLHRARALLVEKLREFHSPKPRVPAADRRNLESSNGK
jgi:RNA polymerase sigma-70 factor, ECF subfamily